MSLDVCVLLSGQVRLIFKGQPMVDEKTLEESSVLSGDVIHMIAQLRGGF